MRLQICKKSHLLLTFFADLMGVANESRSAHANCSVVFNLAVGPNPAGQRKAWVFTFLINACKMRSTVRVNQTFRLWS